MNTTWSDDELTARSAVELRRLIDAREVSPVELLEACIRRIERINPYVNAITATCFDRARQEAREAEQAVMRNDARGLLHGLPMGIKDLEPTAGLLTTMGSPLFRNNVPSRDIELVARLRRAGGIVVGMTNVPQLGAGANSFNPVWGATGNPFNPNLNAGGSSGGSAAALATDMLPVCTGSDTGGSVRIPAAMCGVVGLRPSPGLVPSVRKVCGWSSISVVGPMGRTVEDACLQLAATAGMHPGDPLSYPASGQDFLEPPLPDLGSLRVGWSADLGSCDVDPEIRQTFGEKISAMRHLFKSCEPVDVELGDVHRCFDILRAEVFAASLQETYQKNPSSLGPLSRANYEMAASMSLAEAAWAQAEQTRILSRTQGIFMDIDLLLTPTTPISPFPWTQSHAEVIDGHRQANYYRWLALTYVITLTTHPALALPCGLDNRGMPFGIQVVGRFRGDRQLLGAGRAMEKAFAGNPLLQRPRPDLSRPVVVEPGLRSIVTAPPALDAMASSSRDEVSVV